MSNRPWYLKISCGVGRIPFMLSAGFLIASALSAQSDAQGVSGKQRVTPEALLSRNLSHLAPPGANICWVPGTNSILMPINESGGEGTWTEKIDTVTGQRQRLVENNAVSPSPDGTKIAYISAKSGSDQIWTMSLDGTGIKQVTDVPGGVSKQEFSRMFSWAPDSHRIAYIRPGGSAPSVLPAIWSVDVSTGVSKKIAACKSSPDNLFWMADGETVVYFYDQHSIAVSVATGTDHAFMDHTGADAMLPIPSPDGKEIAFACADYHGGYWHHWQIAFASVNGGPIHRFSTPFKTYPLGWSPDGKRIIIWRRSVMNDQILSMSKDGQLDKSVIQTRGQYGGSIIPVISPDGVMAWTELDWQGRTLLQVASELNPEVKTIVNFTPDIDSFSLVDPEVVHWKSHDGLQDFGMLIKPANYVPGKKYPLLVDLHGGPGSGVLSYCGFICISPLEWQMWAEKGYVVFAPEYRSSGYYGFDPILKERQTRKAYDGDFDDIMSGVDRLIADGIVDGSKMAVAGHSYGAVETDWIITHTHRFRAAISYEGYADLYGDYGKYGKANTIWEWQLNGTPSTVPEAYLYNSPIYRENYITTPTLFINAENGINSTSQSSMHLALSDRGVDTQYLSYKDEGHVIEKPENLRGLTYWCINWVDTHLGFPPTPDPKEVFQIPSSMATSKRVTER